MSRFLRLSLLATAILLMIACGLSTTPAANSNAILANNVVALAVQAQPITFNAVGQEITFNYSVTNVSTSPLTGPVTVTDNKVTGINCPDLKTIGNKDDKLDGGAAETEICTAKYITTQDDINTGAITSVSLAHVAGNDSTPITTVVNIALNKVLTISVSANPTTYSQAGQTITFNYVVTNAGTATLQPAQFVVNDDHVAAPIPCGLPNTTLAATQSVQCSATYVTTPNDATVAQIKDTASATGAGAGTIQPGSATVNNTNVVGSGSNPSTTYQRGSTVRHPVSSGEWLLQIARCYGANYDAVLGANPQIVDPDLIFVPSTVVVPNIGSFATPYGPPCIKPYTVKQGDTWQSIANDPTNDAGVSILMAANQDTTTLSAGKVITIPLHSKPYENVVVPAPTTPPPGTNQPIRLNFSAQNPKVTQPGNIGTPQTIRYVFTGAAGQILTVKLTVATNDVGFAVFGPNNQTLKALSNDLSWSGTLTANGDHFIDVISSLGAASKAYTLEVTLTSPGAASPFERVSDINKDAGDSKPSYMSVFNGSLYFQAMANNNPVPELWKYDAGLNASSRLAETVPNAAGITPTFLMPFQNMLYFSADGHDGGGAELWRFNGSAVGRVTDLNPGTADSNPMYLTLFNNALYFTAKSNDNKGPELWKFDGNTTPTRVIEVNPDIVSNPAYLAEFNKALYFSGTSSQGGTELWKYDGTNATLVKDINQGVGNSNPAFLTVLNNVLYFSADGNDNTGTELWKFDGATVSRASDINKSPDGSVPTYLTVFNNALYFSANGDASGYELWKFDGANATRVGDLNPAGNANPAFLTAYNNQLYFQANANDGAGAELWKYKGQ